MGLPVWLSRDDEISILFRNRSIKVNITIDIHNTTILRPILLLDQFAVKLTERYFTAKHTSGGSSGRIQDGG